MSARFLLCLLVCLCSFLFLYRLGDRALQSSHEARAAQNAQSIVADGHWLLPRLLDRRIELQKPPLYYWLVALCAQIFGGEVDAWAVRLPSALSAILCVFFVVFLLWRCGRPGAGLCAGFILATSLHFTWLGRVGRIDMPLTLMVTVSLGNFFLASRRRRESPGTRTWPLLAMGYVAIALGILLKGPIALVLVALVAGAFTVLERQRQKNGELAGSARSLLWGVPLMLAIAAPWFIWANFETGNKIWDVFFWYHNLERGLGSEVLASHPVWFYLPRALIDLAPWSIVAPALCWYFVRSGYWPTDGPARLGACWFLAIFAFLSVLSFKRADYLLPAYPGLAVFLGCALERVLENMPSRRRVLMLGAVASCYLLCWGVFIETQRRDWPEQRLAHDIRRQTHMPVIFFRAEAHAFAFHVGRPLDTILEWENLDVWAGKKLPVYFVMPPDCARDWPGYLGPDRHLEEVARTDDVDRPLVVLRSLPP